RHRGEPARLAFRNANGDDRLSRRERADGLLEPTDERWVAMGPFPEADLADAVAGIGSSCESGQPRPAESNDPRGQKNARRGGECPRCFHAKNEKLRNEP